MNKILQTKDDILHYLSKDHNDEVDPLVFKRLLVSMKESWAGCPACNKPKEGTSSENCSVICL